VDKIFGRGKGKKNGVSRTEIELRGEVKLFITEPRLNNI
jgi:hypothetical protein